MQRQQRQEQEGRGAICRDGSKGKSKSCLSTKSLLRIQQAVQKSGRWGTETGGVRHNKQSSSAMSTTSRDALIESLQNLFYEECKDSKKGPEKDSCIVQKASDLDESLKTIHESELLPIAPHNGLLTGKPWSTREVQIAMKAIEDRHPEFLFIGPTPIDFDLKDDVGQCVVSELCKMSLKEILKMGKRTFGIIFNTHKHTDPGGHWICLFGCIPSGRCIYFDSYGFFPEAEVMNLMIEIKKQYDTLFKDTATPMSLIYNDEQHQFGGVECGTYCIVFLKEMANHGNIRTALKTMGSDSKIITLRDQLLSKNISLPEDNTRYETDADE
jgi:hypothetical protein